MFERVRPGPVLSIIFLIAASHSPEGSIKT